MSFNGDSHSIFSFRAISASRPSVHGRERPFACAGSHVSVAGFSRSVASTKTHGLALRSALERHEAFVRLAAVKEKPREGGHGCTYERERGDLGKRLLEYNTWTMCFTSSSSSWTFLNVNIILTRKASNTLLACSEFTTSAPCKYENVSKTKCVTVPF